MTIQTTALYPLYIHVVRVERFGEEKVASDFRRSLKEVKVTQAYTNQSRQADILCFPLSICRWWLKIPNEHNFAVPIKDNNTISQLHMTIAHFFVRSLRI